MNIKAIANAVILCTTILKISFEWQNQGKDNTRDNNKSIDVYIMHTCDTGAIGLDMESIICNAVILSKNFPEQLSFTGSKPFRFPLPPCSEEAPYSVISEPIKIPLPPFTSPSDLFIESCDYLPPLDETETTTNPFTFNESSSSQLLAINKLEIEDGNEDMDMFIADLGLFVVTDNTNNQHSEIWDFIHQTFTVLILFILLVVSVGVIMRRGKTQHPVYGHESSRPTSNVPVNPANTSGENILIDYFDIIDENLSFIPSLESTNDKEYC